MNIKEVVESSGKHINELVDEIGGIRRIHFLNAMNGTSHPPLLDHIRLRLKELGYVGPDAPEPEEVDGFDIARFDATPVAKQMMEQYNIDPAGVSSLSGRITIADVKRHIKNKE